MLQEIASKKDKMILPTGHQLKDLIASIEPRCQQIGFIEEVISYQRSLRQIADVRGLASEHHRCLPDSEGIHQLVGALRQLFRVVASTTAKISIQALDLIRFSNYKQFNHHIPIKQLAFHKAKRPAIGDKLLDLRLSPFQSARSVSEVMNTIFFRDTTEHIKLQAPPDGRAVFPLPRVIQHLKRLEKRV